MSNNFEQVTAVVGFGSASESGFVLVELDAASHTDSDGNVASSFLPGEDVFILVHHGEDVSEIRSVDTANGTIEILGTVSRENTVDLEFAPDVETVELPHIPTGLVSFTGFGVVGNLEATGSRQLVSAVQPAIYSVTYRYEATLYRYRLPSIFPWLNEDAELPVDFYVETTEAK